MIIKTQSIAANSDRLTQCEAVIERGLSVFFDVGQALAEIRDDKLYQATHKTFEAYCKERWKIGRSRAYELIDQAKVVTAIADAGVDLSAAADISKRDARALKGDGLPAAAAEIKQLVDGGESPQVAAKTVVAKKSAEKAAEQAKNDAYRDENRAALSPKVQQQEQARAAAKAKKPEALPAEDRIAELEQNVAALEKENADLKARIKKFGEMEAEYQKGGFDEVVRGKDEVIATLKTRVERESTDKVSWKRAADMWRKRAEDSGWSNDVAIDIETGVVGRA